MKATILNVGFGNVVVASRVVAIVSPHSAPMRRLKDHARDLGKLIDDRTRAIIVTDSDHVILSGIQPDTLAQRLAARTDKE
jgi:regulator of extracellular matrix RemA (YlzA/DUF370 family)